MIETLEKFEACLEEYFKIFIEYYPDSCSMKDSGDFAPAELYQLANEAHCLAAILGSYCIQRLNYVGFDEYIPFDNPVDWYNWASHTRDNKVPRETYLSIGIRIDSELKRIRYLIENNHFDSYENLSYSKYLISKNKYDKLKEQTKNESTSSNQTTSKQQESQPESSTPKNNNVESEAIGNLDKLHKKSSIVTSWLAILAKFLG